MVGNQKILKRKVAAMFRRHHFNLVGSWWSMLSPSTPYVEEQVKAARLVEKGSKYTQQ